MKRIKIQYKENFYYTIVDDNIFDFLKDKSLHLSKCSEKKRHSEPYVRFYIKSKVQKLHRYIMNAKKGQIVDHINGNTLDNRKENLRFVNNNQNSTNRKKIANTTSKYKGVSYARNVKKWSAQVNHKGNVVYRERFESEIDAAKAYDVAALKYHGKFANLNFKRENYEK